MATLDDVIAAKDRLSDRLLRKRRPKVALAMASTVREARAVAGRNLHALGVGYKLVNGKATRTLCVRLYVVQKLPKRLIPPDARLPDSVAGCPTDVIESPVVRIQQPSCSSNRRRRQRPITGGISAAHPDVLRSTLGCSCRSVVSGQEQRRYLLGCNHGFANLGAGSRGDPILQPSAGDGGALLDRVARLARFVPIQLGYAPNRVDAALAEVLSTSALRNEICTIRALRGITTAKLDMIVCKHGRTTGYTEGKVVDVSMDPIVIDYPGGAFATFVNQLRVDPTRGYVAPPDEVDLEGWFAAPGDSGSVLVDKKSRKAVGLHFAGQYGVSVANQIKEVCSLLQISIP